MAKSPAATPMTSAVNHTLPRGGGCSVLDANYPPQTGCWPLWGGGGGHGGGGSKRGEWGGGSALGHLWCSWSVGRLRRPWTPEGDTFGN